MYAATREHLGLASSCLLGETVSHGLTAARCRNNRRLTQGGPVRHFSYVETEPGDAQPAGFV